MALVDSKLRVKQLKKLTSSLFARQSKYLIVDREHPDMWYYTSIPLDGVVYALRYDSDCRIHCVTFKEKELCENLYALFPVLKGISFCLDLMAINAALNKADKAKACVAPMELIIHQLLIEGVPVGQEISEDQVAMYRVPYENYLASKGQTGAVMTVPIESIASKSDVCPIRLLTDSPASLQSIRQICMPYADGITGPSYFEYIKKCDTPVTYQAEYWFDGILFHVTTHMIETSKLEVVSVLPKVVIYPVYKEQAKKEMNYERRDKAWDRDGSRDGLGSSDRSRS